MVRPSRTLDPLFRKPAKRDPAQDLQRRADRICSLIVASDYPDIDIDIEIHNLRQWCEKHIPARRDLFEIIYVNRFRRLRDQFRS
ncbi:MAG: hypothetical protein ABFS42_12390 [Candidatus Krumholzibacteriota bacterium]